MVCDDPWHRVQTIGEERCPSCGGERRAGAPWRPLWHLVTTVPLFLQDVWRSVWERPSHAAAVGVPWPPWLVVTVVGAVPVIGAAFAVVEALSQALVRKGPHFWLLASELASLLAWLALVWYCLRRYGTGWGALGLRRFHPGAALGYVGAAWLGKVIVFQFLALFLRVLVPSADLAAPYVPSLASPVRGTASTSTRLVAMLLAVVVVPFFEELLFRGLLFAALARTLGAGAAAICSSVLFAALHPDPYAALHAFLGGVLACFLYCRLGSLWPAVAFHGWGNLLASLTP
jgi:membrane protease YdiL (CAAX protease family)